MMNARMQWIAFGVMALGLILLWLSMNEHRKRKKIQALKHEYDQALAVGDQKRALEAGIAYYRTLNDGKASYAYPEIVRRDMKEKN